MATILDPNDPTTFSKCSEYLSLNGCVAFPTETVYGLGANALNADAVLSIFKFKGRPLSDPLIVHCKDANTARQLIILEDETTFISTEINTNITTNTSESDTLHIKSAAALAFDLLSALFWPGPLTIVAKAVDLIPRVVTADTGFVGVRVPKHPVALTLLQTCGLPIAAPSANRFGHVSPTSASHVFQDLGQHPIFILQSQEKDREEEKDRVNENEVVVTEKEKGEFGKNLSYSSSSSCAVGIESTVAKIEGFHWNLDNLTTTTTSSSSSSSSSSSKISSSRRSVRITILRRGGVSAQEIKDCLSSLIKQDIDVSVQLASLPSSSSSTSSSSSSKPLPQETHEVHQAPGMLLSHYAPDIPAYLVAKISSSSSLLLERVEQFHIKSSVIVDFGGSLHTLKDISHAYRDLSQIGSVEEACRLVFEFLRWAESVNGAKFVLIADPLLFFLSKEQRKGQKDIRIEKGDRLDALRDRVYRAASGREIEL
jgi:L-threonylcarbamoyladenylate synthase